MLGLKSNFPAIPILDHAQPFPPSSMPSADRAMQKDEASSLFMRHDGDTIHDVFAETSMVLPPLPFQRHVAVNNPSMSFLLKKREVAKGIYKHTMQGPNENRKFMITETIDAQPRYQPASDTLPLDSFKNMTKSAAPEDNGVARLAVLISQHSENKDILTVANTQAILASMTKGDGTVTVADIDERHLAGIQDIMNLAPQASSEKEWLTAVNEKYENIGTSVQNLLQATRKHNDVFAFEHLKDRIENQKIEFIHTDLSKEGALNGLAERHYGVTYASNIELYLSGYKSNEEDEYFQQKLDQFKGNILDISAPDTLFISGSSNNAMNNLHYGREIINNHWNPQAL